MALERMGKTGQAMAFQQEARSNPMGALEMARGPQGLQAAPPNQPPQGQAPPPQGARRSIRRGMSPGAMGGQAPIPQFVPDEVMSMDVKQNLNEMLTATLPDGDSIAAKALEKMIKNNKLLTGMLEETRDITQAASGGGLMQLAAGGEFSGPVPGDGHGMEDNVRMPIKEGEEQVATLAVSPTEYVVDSYTMAALGNGNANEGAEVMDKVVENVREKAYGTDQQPNEINGLAALRPMIERV
jgi:hypothetical protein